MSTPLQRDTNYFFLSQSNYTGGKVTGMTNAEVSVGNQTVYFHRAQEGNDSILVASSKSKPSVLVRAFRWSKDSRTCSRIPN
ncbi:MAG: hypothetical protein IPN95_17305 [Bacteroidetes bacterium]|nr:hypothetical protein [Bacteroidota bacterium]